MDSRNAVKPSLEIHTLRYFLAFVHEGTILGAARTLHITQPTLSRQISNLERQVGSPLYTREGRHIKLTEKGRALYQYAESVVDLVDKAEDMLATPEQRASGYVYIGHSEPASMHLVTRAMVRTRESYPDVRFHLFTGSTSDLFDKLNTGLFDFLVEGEVLTRPDYEKIPLPLADRWGVVMRKDDPLAALDRIAPEDLRGKPILCSRQIIKAGILRTWAGDDFDAMDLVATFNTGSYILSMASIYKLAYVFTYEDIFNLGMTHELCFRPLDPLTESSSGLIWKRNRALSAQAKAFLECVREMSEEGGAMDES